MGSARPGERVSAGAEVGARRAVHPRDDRVVFTWLVLPIVVTTVMATIGAALAPTLLVDAPVALMALNARTEYLVLVAPRVSFGVFVALGSVRWFASSIFFFLLGHRYGEAVVRWAEHRVGGRIVRVAAGLVGRFGWAAVLVSPNAPVSAVAGAGGLGVGSYVVLAAIGTVARLVLIHILGQAFTDPIHEITSVVVSYRWPLTALSVLGVSVVVWRHRRRGVSHLETPDEIEADLEAELADGGPSDELG